MVKRNFLVELIELFTGSHRRASPYLRDWCELYVLGDVMNLSYTWTSSTYHKLKIPVRHLIGNCHRSEVWRRVWSKWSLLHGNWPFIATTSSASKNALTRRKLLGQVTFQEYFHLHTRSYAIKRCCFEKSGNCRIREWGCTSVFDLKVPE